MTNFKKTDVVTCVWPDGVANLTEGERYTIVSHYPSAQGQMVRVMGDTNLCETHRAKRFEHA